MNGKKNVLMVVNPISGDIDKIDIVTAVQFYAARENIHVVLYETNGKDDLNTIRELYDKHIPDRIIVVGGDGTIKAVAEALEDKDVIIGILPAGSANGLSVDLNLPDSLEENVAIAFQNNYIEMDMVSINSIKSLHLSDIGINAALIKNYEKSAIRGKLGYVLQAFTTLSELQGPFEVVIVANNRTIISKARMVVIANSKKYGTGITINPLGKMNDGKFEIVIVKSLDLVVLIKIISGNIPIESNEVEIISTDKATITTDFPISFQVDGEYYGELDKLEVEISRNQMKVAIP